jgi:hypothetical protein
MKHSERPRDYADPNRRLKQGGAGTALCASLLMYILAAGENGELHKIPKWPTTDATIARVNSQKTKSGDYVYQLNYTYTVNGKQFLSNKIMHNSVSDRVESVKEVPKINDTVTVRYNPVDPHESMLKLNPHEQSGWYYGAAFLPFVAIGFFLSIVPTRRAGAHLRKRFFPPLKPLWEVSSHLSPEEVLSLLQIGMQPQEFEDKTLCGRRNVTTYYFSATTYPDWVFAISASPKNSCSVLRGKVFDQKNGGCRIEAYFDSDCFPSIYGWWL